MKTKTFGGGLYFVTFNDDHSRKLWVYVLKTKDQMFGVFKQFQASVERETGKKLKCVRTNNGGEYCGPFDEYCRQQDIRHQKTPPKTPQLNCLAEKMNMTLMERVRCLLSEVKLLGFFWDEALYIVAHVINLSPIVVLQDDVPDKVWYGKDVSYSHLRVFGCKAFVHVPKDERSKLDAKTRDCIFIGYGHDEFAYRFYDHVEKNLVRSRDVIFVEDQIIEDIGKIEKSESLSTDDVIDFDPASQTDMPNVADFDSHDDDVQDYITNDFVDDNDDVVGDFGEPHVPIRRSSRQRLPSTHYSSNEFVFLTDGGELECYKEAMKREHKKKFVQELIFQQQRYVLFCDSQSAIHLSKNPTFHGRSKHIDVRYHWIRDILDSKLLELEKIHTDDNGLDMMTKTLPKGKFKTCRFISGLAFTLS